MSHSLHPPTSGSLSARRKRQWYLDLFRLSMAALALHLVIIGAVYAGLLGREPNWTPFLVTMTAFGASALWGLIGLVLSSRS
ncbi:hypothetical protein U5903_21270 [Cereibacter johrii]|uniref:hypothetical protein n=1 Tax=Cereibacter johrii TaxID=445629 RepID=UPI002B257D7E|nr:hypothetical protein [Cereibacter johrii]MEA5163324.1 hypothetical protein [Cereibacter johrii]